MLRSKIHRATVTDASLNYVGSVSIDPALLQAADIRPYEQVVILDIDNGNRFETYAMTGGAGQICLNGAAARLVQPGDLVIILSYADYTPEDLAGYSPRIIHVDRANHQISEREAQRLAGLDPRAFAISSY